jgi:hypothetical protein
VDRRFVFENAHHHRAVVFDGPERVGQWGVDAGGFEGTVNAVDL